MRTCHHSAGDKGDRPALADRYTPRVTACRKRDPCIIDTCTSRLKAWQEQIVSCLIYTRWALRFTVERMACISDTHALILPAEQKETDA